MHPSPSPCVDSLVAGPRARKALWPVILAICLALGFAAPVQAAEPLVIAVARLTLSLPFYVAESEGYFRDAGVDIKLEDCAYGRVCLDRMLDGKAQLATVAESPIVLAGTRGRRFAILSTINVSRGDVKIVARKSSGVRSAVDLVDRKIGVFVGTTAHYYLHLAIILSGGDPSETQLVPVQADDDVAGLMKSGRIDAVALFEPYGWTVMKGLGGDAVVLSSTLYLQIFNLVASSHLVGARDADLERILRALDRAIRFIETSPQRAREILRARLGMGDAEIDWAWRGLNFGLNLDASLLHALEGQARWALRFGYASGEVPDFRDFVHPGPLSRVRPDALKLWGDTGGAKKLSGGKS